MPKERTVHAKTYSAGPAPTGASGGLGQHFIKNIAVVHNIVEKAGIKPTDIVLEIGPGNGIMTMELLKKAKKVIAIELDPRMVNEVQKKVQGTYSIDFVDYVASMQTTFKLFMEISLKWNFHILICVLLMSLTSFPQELYSSFSNTVLSSMQLFSCSKKNLPSVYVQSPHSFHLSCRPGDNMYCRLSVNTQLLARTQQLLKVGRNNFNPPPKVESRVCRIEPYNPPPSVNFVVGHDR